VEPESNMKTYQVNDVKTEDLTIRMGDSLLNHEGNYDVSVLMITDHFFLSHIQVLRSG
jgi:hypothetical protein